MVSLTNTNALTKVQLPRTTLWLAALVLLGALMVLLSVAIKSNPLVSDDRLEALFTVALACGLRQSETLGLRWSDVNVDAGTLSIQRTLQRVNGAFTFFPPKTARSRRTIVMPGPVAAALLQHMKLQLEERMIMGAAWEGDAWER